MKKTDKPVVLSQRFNAPITKVWNAITVLEEMKQWYFENIDAFAPELGTKSKFVVQSGERTFTHQWEITQVKAPHLIEYNWKYEEYAGEAFVSFALGDENGKTTLELSMEVCANFDDTIPEFKRESCEMGWQYFIQQRLAAYLKI